MYRVWFYGLIFMTAVGLSHCLFNNQWIPLTEDEVYWRNEINRNKNIIRAHFPSGNSENADYNMAEDNKVKPIMDSVFQEIVDLHQIRNKAIKLVKPDIRSQFGQQNDFKPIEPETIKSVNELQKTDSEPNNNDYKNKEMDRSASFTNVKETKKIREDLKEIKIRKSKAILDDSINNDVIEQDAKVIEDTEILKTQLPEDKVQDDTSRAYKVTEDPIETPIDELRDTTKRSGYFYTPPKLNLNYPTQNNFTDTFLDILSRHNIKPVDELPNYTLSRKNRIQDSLNAFMFLPIPLRVLPQFNNLKQLSVDPLLAVLMSNYGYYFPGSYGIHSRYRNLYGHLASNNIHNNKPFGSYKIYSDTDSSN